MNALINLSTGSNVPLNPSLYGWDTLQKIDPSNIKRVVQAIQSDGQLKLTEDSNKRRYKDTSDIASNSVKTSQQMIQSLDLQKNPGKVQQLIQQIKSEAQAVLTENPTRSNYADHSLSLFEALNTYKDISKLH